MATTETYRGRNLRLVLKPAEGIINFFRAYVNGHMVIANEGDKQHQWKGIIPNTKCPLEIRVAGINDSKYTIIIDLPGTADDQKLTFSLQGGYHEFEINL